MLKSWHSKMHSRILRSLFLPVLIPVGLHWQSHTENYPDE